MSRCAVSGKIRYKTQAAATGPDTTVGIYRCVYCEDWHRSREKSKQNMERVARVRARKRPAAEFPLIDRLPPETVRALTKMAERD